jgi:3-oxoacyl-[acyl-carrier protein] reductase
MSRHSDESPVALITGATGGWGRGVAFALAADGVRVALNARSQSAVEELVAEVRSTGGTAVAVADSVETLAGARRIVARTISHYGRLDILVSSAGLLRTGPLLELAEETWDSVIRTELTGVFTCTKAAAEQMVRQQCGGRVVIVAGGAGIYGLPGDSAHAAAKAGVASACRSWAEELAPYRITVNAVRGGVRSRYTSEHVASFNEATSQNRVPRDYGFFEPGEAAPLVTWLASKDADDITGCYIGIDGPRISVWQPGPPEPTVYHFPCWNAQDIGLALKPLLAQAAPVLHGEDLLLTTVDLSPWLSGRIGESRSSRP